MVHDAGLVYAYTINIVHYTIVCMKATVSCKYPKCIVSKILSGELGRVKMGEGEEGRGGGEGGERRGGEERGEVGEREGRGGDGRGGGEGGEKIYRIVTSTSLHAIRPHSLCEPTYGMLC